jgi:CHAT domain
MNQRNIALASLWDRTYRAAVTRDPSMLLDEMALGDARKLIAAVNPETDIPAAHALGWFCWLRYMALSGHDASQELYAALSLLKPVFERNPYAVPGPLQRWYMQTEANSYAHHYIGGADSGRRPWSGARHLPVFHAAVRSTVDAAPESQPDRAKFLLAAALMLRSIAGRSADEAILAEAAEVTLAALGTGPATLPSQTDVRMSIMAEAFLEPVGGPSAAEISIESAWPAKAALPRHRPAADLGVSEYLSADWRTAATSAPRWEARPDEQTVKSAPMHGSRNGYSASRRPTAPPAGSYAPAREERLLRDRERKLAPLSALRSVAPSPRPMDVPEPVRHLWAQLPDRVGVGHRIPLLVWISMTSKAGASAPLKPFPVPGQGRRIVVAVSAPGFELSTDADQELLVPPSGDSEPIRFAMRAVMPGLHRVKVDAFASGTFLGRVELQVSAEVGAGLTEGVPRRIDLHDVSGKPGEITLQVNREDGAYSFQLIGTSWYRRVLVQSLAADPTEVVERILAELRAIARGESGFTSPRAVREHIKNLGTKLWSDIVPDAVRRQFWEEADKISSFVVMSNLDMIPWELLHAVDRGRPELGFLAEHVPVVRRVYECTPAYSLPLLSSAYVVPPKSPRDADAEVSDVRAVMGPRVRDQGIVSRLDALQELFGAPPGLLHFACHNTFSPTTGSVVRMDGGPVRPDDLEQSKRRLTMAAANPLVFFNACRTAGEIYGFTQMSGWASQFMAAGAGAFIGTLWPVRSATARMFATSFYKAIVHRGATLGEASLQARRSVSQDLEDPTWLAYSVYGSPAAKVLG